VSNVYGVAVNTVAKSVNPSATVLDTFTPGVMERVWIYLENTDGSQTLEGVVQTRLVAGTGTWATSPSTELSGIAAGEARLRPVDVIGAGEARIVATASGAGLTANYGRSNMRATS
jgi:hypothetical protein